MKLEPIAKPIKIRIMIGGNEYSDLESVKRDFSIKDLFPLFKDGRLERWLKQIGENELAKRVGELSNHCKDKCEHDDGHARIQFFSLFFDDVEKSLSEYENKSKGERSLSDYLLLLETIFKHPQFFELIDGEMLSGRVKTKKDYKIIFEFLKNKPECKDIISKFYSECKKKGYQWDMAFDKKDFSLDDIVYFYQNECFYIPFFDWGKLFADYVKNWSTDSEKIEAIIKDNSDHKKSFYEHCAKNGFEEAEAKKRLLDPWDFLANSKDYELVIKAIKRWKAVGIDNKKYNFEYKNLETPLGKQILEFLSNIRAFGAVSWQQNYDDSEYYLKDEREVMKCIQSCPYSGCYRLIDPKTEKTLRDMEERGVELATYALNRRGRFNYDFIVSDHVVDQFYTKLRSKKKDIV